MLSHTRQDDLAHHWRHRISDLLPDRFRLENMRVGKGLQACEFSLREPPRPAGMSSAIGASRRDAVWDYAGVVPGHVGRLCLSGLDVMISCVSGDGREHAARRRVRL